jgi:dolichyl-phosphate beta-glucosyltransferase
MTGILNSKMVIIIPSYNEEKRLHINEFISFLKEHSTVKICFVNDGSKDDTLKVFQQIQEAYKENVDIVSNEKNVGKAESIRRGMQYCNSHLNYDIIAYLDADLSTSLNECFGLSAFINDEISFCFGSRILKIGSVIERSFIKHIVGRTINTMISWILKIDVYDTQCGCKLIRRDLAIKLFEEPFISTWLFDVEIFARIIKIFGRSESMNKMQEVPLHRWIDHSGSKVKITYVFRLWYDLISIYRTYKDLR